MRRIFKRDPYAKIDRRKQRAEKKHMRARENAWRKRRRKEEWEIFKKRFSDFFANPFAKKKLSAEKQEAIRIKKIIRHERKLAWQKWWTKFRKNPLRVIFPRKKQRTEDGGYLYVYHMTKRERDALARKKRQERRENFKRIFTLPELRSKFLVSFFHSTAYFLFSFSFIYVLYQVMTIIATSSFNIPVIWYYYGMEFPLYTYSPLYTRTALVTIFAAGPIFSIMLAFMFLKLYFSDNAGISRFKLLWLWGFISGCNMFFGSYIAGFFTHTEFIYVSEWLFMSNVFDLEQILFTVISFVMLLIIGRIITPLFLMSSGSVTFLRPEFRFFFIITQFILPWVTGVIIFFLIALPNVYPLLIIKTLTPGFMLIPSLFLYDLLQYQNIHKTGPTQHNYVRWSIVILVIALLFFYRVILNFGLKFT
jgi:hypothetical protein